MSTLTLPAASDTPDLPKRLIYIERSEGWDNVRAEFGTVVEILAEGQGWQFESVLGNPDHKAFEQAS